MSIAQSQELSHAHLLDLVEYSPQSGEFVAKTATRGYRAGRVMGRVDSRGYVRITIKGVNYAAGRLAWFYMTGEWPLALVDHRDTVRSNNRWANIRLATKSQNNSNSGKQANNTSGHKGVYWNKSLNKWLAAIHHNGRQINLGHHTAKEDAVAAYRSAAIQYHGEFARF